MLINILYGLAAGGAAYYLCAWIAARFELGRMTYIEVRNAQIEEELQHERKLNTVQRLDRFMSGLGYSGDWTPLLLGVALVYMLVAVGLSMARFGDVVGAAIALPISIVSSIAALSRARMQRSARFERQLLQVVSSVSTYLEAGDVPQMAFQKAARHVDNPLRGELESALASKVGSESLASAMKSLAERYPSRPMTLLVTALNIDDRVGAKLSPALRQAQKTLERQFELAAEANAEISQAKGEFYAISIVILLIGLFLMAGSGSAARDAYLSPTGAVVLGLTGANYLIGILRARGIFRKAGRS